MDSVKRKKNNDEMIQIMHSAVFQTAIAIFLQLSKVPLGSVLLI